MYTGHGQGTKALHHHAQEDQEYDVVPGSQFSVTRTAHRSNQSDYYINDRKVSPKDVTERLKSNGIDLDNNRFLILQVGSTLWNVSY